MVSLIDAGKQNTFQCPAPLLLAVGDLVHALWVGGRETAVYVVGKMPGFWTNVTSALFKKEPVLATSTFDAEADSRLKGAVVALGILAIELYGKGNEAEGKDAASTEFLGVLDKLMTDEKLVLWLGVCAKISAAQAEGRDSEGKPLDPGAAALTLLSAIQRLVLVATSLKGTYSPPPALRNKLVNTAVDILCA